MKTITVTGTATVKFRKTIYVVSEEDTHDVLAQDVFQFADCNIDESDVTAITEFNDVHIKAS